MRTIPFGRPIIGEEEKRAVADVLESGVMAHGPKLEAFEDAFAERTGAPHAVAVSSCTAALHLLYFHLGLGPGDEVIVPAMTHVATAHAVELTGAKAVFVDAEPRTGNIDLDQVAARINERTRALSVVHYLGVPVDMAPLQSLARERGLHIVEDCALAVETRRDGVHAGLFGDAGCFSFYPVKHITSGEGGMVITRDADLARSIRKQRAFGMDKHVRERKVPGVYDVQALGFNYRMNDIQAAIGIEQLRRLDGFMQLRARNHARLHSGLEAIEELQLFETEAEGVQSSYYCLSAVLGEGLVTKRADVIEALRARGVGTSVYYPHPVPRMTYYREKHGYDGNAFPVATRIADASIALPVGPHLSDNDVDYIIAMVKEAIAGANKK